MATALQAHRETLLSDHSRRPDALALEGRPAQPDRAAGRRRRHGARGGVRPRAVPLQPRGHHHRAHRHVSRAGRTRLVLLRAAACPARHRPAGGALPRGARAVAAGAAAQRGRCRIVRARPGEDRRVGGDARAARRIGDREVPGIRPGPRSRAAQPLALRCRDGRHRGRGGRDLHRRPRLPQAGRAGRARARVERRGREPVPHRRAAGPRDGRTRRRRHGDGARCRASRPPRWTSSRARATAPLSNARR